MPLTIIIPFRRWSMPWGSFISNHHQIPLRLQTSIEQNHAQLSQIMIARALINSYPLKNPNPKQNSWCPCSFETHELFLENPNSILNWWPENEPTSGSDGPTSQARRGRFLMRSFSTFSTSAVILKQAIDPCLC